MQLCARYSRTISIVLGVSIKPEVRASLTLTHATPARLFTGAVFKLVLALAIRSKLGVTAE